MMFLAKRQSTVAAVAFAIVSILAFGVNAQTTKWVDQASGNDGNDGNSEATAYASLQVAIDASTSGTPATPSIVNVKDGAYGQVGLTNRDGYGTAILIKDLDYLTLQAVPGHGPQVLPVTAVEANIVSVSVDNSDHLTVDHIGSNQRVAQFDNWHVFDSNNLTVKNSTFEGGEDGIDFSTGVSNVLIENNSFVDVNTGSGDEVLDFTDGTYSDIVIQDNLFQNNYRQITINPPSGNTATGIIIWRNVMNGTTSQEAVRLIRVDDVALQNNVIMHSTQQALYIDSGSSNINVWHNTFFKNGEEEIRTKVSSADITIQNNIIYANGSSAGISASTASLPGENFNLIFNDGLDTESSQGPISVFGANTILGLDPLLFGTVLGGEDMHLQFGSPALQAGTDLGVASDLELGIRPSPAGSSPDMGAYEAGPFFESRGQCTSTLIREHCFGLKGRERAACNHEQRRICAELIYE